MREACADPIEQAHWRQHVYPGIKASCRPGAALLFEDEAKSGHSQIGHWVCEKRDFTCEIRPLEGPILLCFEHRGQTIVSHVKFAKCPIPMRSDLERPGPESCVCSSQSESRCGESA